jgi:subtilisin family serine protease
MTRGGPYILAAASIAVILCALVFNYGSNHRDAPSSLSVKLAHGDIAVLASSYAPIPSVQVNNMHAFRLAEIRAIAASVTQEDAREMSIEIFEKSKFSLLGSHNNGSSASFSTRKLDYKSGDKQYFVQFSTSTDIYTLVALAKFTGRPVVSHVHDDLYLAIGGDSFPVRARQFPGVGWVQERAGLDKVSHSLKLLLDKLSQESIMTRLRNRFFPQSSPSQSDPVVKLIVQCWHDACGTAGNHVQTLCPDVYVYPELVEVHCRASAVERSVALLTGHAGVEHVDIKQRIEHKNFAGSAIVGTGPSATSILESRVLTSIDVSDSVVGVADTGINMNNCYFYDASKNSFPYTDSRVLKQYTFQHCSFCGRCCASYSPGGCTNTSNACGNSLDQDGHGTHVAGTIAGNAGASAPVSLGNGIAAGAKLFFQDIENLQPDTTCFYTNSCDGLYPGSNLANLFDPAYAAGVYVLLIPLSSARCVCCSFVQLIFFCLQSRAQ